MSHRPMTNTSSLKIAAAYCVAWRAGTTNLFLLDS
jgi:hypothetical protein